MPIQGPNQTRQKAKRRLMSFKQFIPCNIGEAVENESRIGTINCYTSGLQSFADCERVQQTAVDCEHRNRLSLNARWSCHNNA
jgi:hypothetical protein